MNNKIAYTDAKDMEKLLRSTGPAEIFHFLHASKWWNLLEVGVFKTKQKKPTTKSNIALITWILVVVREEEENPP